MNLSQKDRDFDLNYDDRTIVEKKPGIHAFQEFPKNE